MKPLKCFVCNCRPPYPQIGEKLVLRSGTPEEGLDYQYADWGVNFAGEMRHISTLVETFGHFNDEYHPAAIILTTERYIIKAIIPISQPRKGIKNG